ncbi:hypothetical protein ABIA38_001034 [Embleya sp. AB8]
MAAYSAPSPPIHGDGPGLYPSGRRRPSRETAEGVARVGGRFVGVATSPAESAPEREAGVDVGPRAPCRVAGVRPISLPLLGGLAFPGRPVPPDADRPGGPGRIRRRAVGEDAGRERHGRPPTTAPTHEHTIHHREFSIALRGLLKPCDTAGQPTLRRGTRPTAHTEFPGHKAQTTILNRCCTPDQSTAPAQLDRDDAPLDGPSGPRCPIFATKAPQRTRQLQAAPIESPEVVRKNPDRNRDTTEQPPPLGTAPPPTRRTGHGQLPGTHGKLQDAALQNVVSTTPETIQTTRTAPCAAATRHTRHTDPRHPHTATTTPDRNSTAPTAPLPHAANDPTSISRRSERALHRRREPRLGPPGHRGKKRQTPPAALVLRFRHGPRPSPEPRRRTALGDADEPGPSHRMS